LPSSDPPKDGFAVANRRPEFIRPGRRGDRGGTSEKGHRSPFSTSYFVISTSQRERVRGSCRAVALREGGFTLLELLVVIAIIAILMVLIAPAFTSIKSGSDVNSAAYTIKGVLDTACTYAKTNNTYTWVGFYEEDVSQPSTNPPTAGIGRIVMSIVASKDGTDPTYVPPLNLTASLTQVGKLTKIDNVHLATFTNGSGQPPGTTFDTRPPVTYTVNNTQTQYSLANLANSSTPFTFPSGSPYTFSKIVQFSSRGEARVNNSVSSYPPQPAAEIGLEPTHGNFTPSSVPANVVAIQFTGIGGNVTIYRR
jgi:prepilin-type N-terminal cleavage/methylation domain-containing protein